MWKIKRLIKDLKHRSFSRWRRRWRMRLKDATMGIKKTA
jgi:hypothetical protein